MDCLTTALNVLKQRSKDMRRTKKHIQVTCGMGNVIESVTEFKSCNSIGTNSESETAARKPKNVY